LAPYTNINFFDSKVDSLWLSGQQEEARRRSLQARNWNVLGMVIGGSVLILGTAMAVFVTASINLSR